MTNGGLNDYELGLNRLLEVCERKGVRVEFVGSEMLHDYMGMNSEAAKEMGFRWPEGLGKELGDWILVGKSLHDRGKYETLLHEMVEFDLMKEGARYFPAHRVALKKEKEPPRKLLKMRRRGKMTTPVLAGVRG